MKFTRDAKEEYIEDALQYSERVFNEIIDYAEMKTNGKFDYSEPFVKEHQISDQLNDDTHLGLDFNVFSKLIDIKTGKPILEMWAGFFAGMGTDDLQYEGSIDPQTIVKELQFLGY